MDIVTVTVTVTVTVIVEIATQSRQIKWGKTPGGGSSSAVSGAIFTPIMMASPSPALRLRLSIDWTD